MKHVDSRLELLKQISVAHFMQEDLALYLNTHPMDKPVIERHNFYVMQSKALTEKYNSHYGMLTNRDVCSPYPWQWINDPWPWEYEANFRFEKEER